MALEKYSLSDIQACTVVRLEKISKNGKYCGWIIGINNKDGIYLDWTDKSLTANPSKEDMRNAIASHLCTEDSIPPKESITSKSMDATNENNVLGETLSEVSSLPVMQVNF